MSMTSTLPSATLHGLFHIAIKTSDLESTRAFWRDIIGLREGVRFAYDVLTKGDGFKDIVIDQYPWDMPLHSDELMRTSIQDRVQTSYHPCGTNRLSKNIDQGVVDPKLKVHGVNRRVICWANRNGFYYVLDRVTGEFLTGVPFVEQNWADGLDPAGRPILSGGVSASGPPRQRLPAGPDPRGALRPDGQGRIQFLQRLSTAAIPNP